MYRLFAYLSTEFLSSVEMTNNRRRRRGRYCDDISIENPCWPHYLKQWRQYGLWVILYYKTEYVQANPPVFLAVTSSFLVAPAFSFKFHRSALRTWSRNSSPVKELSASTKGKVDLGKANCRQALSLPAVPVDVKRREMRNQDIL